MSSAPAKQGAYGKVKTHKTSKLDQLCRPLEVAAGLRFKFASPLENNMKSTDPDVQFCDEMLGKVSRSFAAVIRQLPKEMAIDICIFYLVLRALDTVEDDMEAYKGKEHEKKKELDNFGAVRLNDPQMSLDGIGEGDERVLLQKFGGVARVYQKLPENSRAVIRSITDKMGAGMSEYVSADLAQGTADQAAYDRYCHMVAGLVGEGLTRIFVARGFEKDVLSGQGERVWPFCADVSKQPDNLGLANSMGLFLQKTNIIRDYLEDYVDGRAFWPQTVWKQYTKSGDLGEFAKPEGREQGLKCLNHLVADALELVPDSLDYLARLKSPSVYRFCAIPQLMSIATLAACFDNPKLFTGVVKIRKGLTARLIIACVDGEDAVLWWFNRFARQLAAQVESGSCADARGPIGIRVQKACARIESITAKPAAIVDSKTTFQMAIAGGVVALGGAAVLSVASRG